MATQNLPVKDLDRSKAFFAKLGSATLDEWQAEYVPGAKEKH